MKLNSYLRINIIYRPTIIALFCSVHKHILNKKMLYLTWKQSSFPLSQMYTTTQIIPPNRTNPASVCCPTFSSTALTRFSPSHNLDKAQPCPGPTPVRLRPPSLRHQWPVSYRNIAVSCRCRALEFVFTRDQ